MAAVEKPRGRPNVCQPDGRETIRPQGERKMTYRIVFPRGYRPQIVFACEHCTTLALDRIAAAHASPVQRFNSAYACDLRYDGCKHPDGIKRR
jgi:hypothetical protein